MEPAAADRSMQSNSRWSASVSLRDGNGEERGRERRGGHERFKPLRHVRPPMARPTRSGWVGGVARRTIALRWLCWHSSATSERHWPTMGPMGPNPARSGRSTPFGLMRTSSQCGRLAPIEGTPATAAGRTDPMLAPPPLGRAPSEGPSPRKGTRLAHRRLPNAVTPL